MVKQLPYWRWSSYPAMTGNAKSPEWLETDWILGHFGKQRKRSVTRYIEFVREGKGLEAVWDDKIHPVILGDEALVSQCTTLMTRDAAYWHKSDEDSVSRYAKLDAYQPLDGPRTTRRTPYYSYTLHH